jgi:hypothetical protein
MGAAYVGGNVWESERAGKAATFTAIARPIPYETLSPT